MAAIVAGKGVKKQIDSLREHLKEELYGKD
jgi:hypothetical protein